MSVALPPLPQELIDNIIDHLHNDNISLLNCALVCRAWLSTSRLHLFAKIHLHVPLPFIDAPLASRKFSRLLRLLYKHTELISYIHELQIHFECGGPNPESGFFAADADDMLLPSLLTTFTHVRHFELSSNLGASWDSLPPRVLHAIDAVVRQPSITYVRLSSWVFDSWKTIASLFRHSQNLRGLALRSTELGTVNEDQEQELRSGSSGPRLEFLTLDYVDCPDLGSWLSNEHPIMMDLTNIREFRLAHSDDNCVDRLLRTFGDSLERFHLKPGRIGLQPMTLERCARLRSLRLTLDEHPASLVWVTNVLTSIPVPGILEHVAIEVYIDPKKLMGWRAIDNILTRPGAFDSLKEVAIGVFAHPANAEFLKVQEGLAGLKERGLLRVYQLATKSQKLCSELTPMISSFEEC
ncbi:hypothetical protein IW261DRAFT_1440535 [Armillaria novae-zelandiae]|uniref:F-box domain-containing protein n=1 Tax=Armillaria novae-zelandiae TaxID=153914 RepID=A0AA39PS16_9AGAR|nr:hypothetical protein IW261DRAFT_1440535 [Armillaria novae-zelandiae]